jgi:aminopeptidase-like protein
MFNLKTNSIDWNKLIDESELLYQKLFPICRSIMGNGVRETWVHTRYFLSYQFLKASM